MLLFLKLVVVVVIPRNTLSQDSKTAVKQNLNCIHIFIQKAHFNMRHPVHTLNAIL